MEKEKDQKGSTGGNGEKLNSKLLKELMGVKGISTLNGHCYLGQRRNPADLKPSLREWIHQNGGGGGVGKPGSKGLMVATSWEK